MHRSFFLALLLTSLCVVPPAPGVTIPEGGRSVVGTGGLTTTLDRNAGSSEVLSGGGQRISVQRPNPAKSYSVQLTARCSQAVTKGDLLLAVIRARNVSSLNQNGFVAKLQLATAPYTPLAPTTEASVPQEWTEIPVLFRTEQSAPEGAVVVQLHLGHRAQVLEIASVQVYQYPSGRSTEDFPRLLRSYPGREAGAVWRKEALERIERHRKADLSLVVKDENGAPLRQTEVQVHLQRHEFGFGTAVVAQRLVGETPDDKRYQEIVDRYFSMVVFENDLKDGGWEPFFNEPHKQRRNAGLEAAFSWVGRRNIAVRGHYLMQIPRPYNFYRTQDPQEIRTRVLASVEERLNFVRDRVVEWDVINHPIAWESADMLNKLPGLEHLDEEVYQLARRHTKLPFFVNEDQIFRPGRQAEETYSYIKSLQARGLVIEGLGNQAHFSDDYLPSPEHILAVTDRYAQLVPRQSITEFDVVTREDEQLAADFTRDILIATFSHPAYSSFLFWGFWEGTHWIPAAASWTRDWTIRKRGEVIEEYLGRVWVTKVTLKTDDEGRLNWRGFPGWYEVKVKDRAMPVNLTHAQPFSNLQLRPLTPPQAAVEQ